MLKLEKLELRGFKSFCDHTELDFTETITAIVGPNGCGKSNLADSITWVLGEQSARLLRGSKMEDVIFQGTHHRPPIGVAEVTLTLVARQDFSTNNGHRGGEQADGAIGEPTRGFELTVAAGERLTVGRRLYRSGESEYLLNGRRVRLRDIQDLFAGTGLGPGHYAIIGQGHVEEILTAKPYERRSVIEDAAGITKFRLRQRTIELRLQAARQNLARIDDVIAELERQVRSLKRQAAKARRFRRFKEELRGWLARFFVAESRRIASSLMRLDEQLAAGREHHAELMRTIDSLEVEYHEAIEASRRGEAELNEARERLSAIALDKERARSEQSGHLEHLKNLELKREEIQHEQKTLRGRLALIEQQREQCRLALDDLSHTVQFDQSELNRQEDAYRAVLAQIREAEEELESLRQRVLEETNHHAQLRHAARQVDVDLERLQQRIDGLRAERERALSKRAEVEAQRARLKQAVTDDRQRLAELAAIIAGLEEHLNCANEERTARLEERAALEKERLAVEERLALLIELDRQHAYCSPAVQRLFQQREREENGFRILGTLADYVRVRRRDEPMVERVLGDALQMVLVPTLEEALRALAFLKRSRSGRATFLIVGLQGGEPSMKGERAAERPSPAETSRSPRSLLEVLGLKPSIADAVRRAFPELATAEIAADLDAAIERSFVEPGKYIIAPDGTRVRNGRVIIGGNDAGEVKSLLGIKREIQDLRRRAGELNRAWQSVDEQLAVVERRMRDEQARLDEARSQYQREEKSALERALQLTSLEQDLTRAEQHLRVVEVELSQAEADRTELEAKRDRLRRAERAADAALTESKTEHQQAQERLVRVRADVAEVSEKLSTLRMQAATANERKRSLEADQERLTAEAEEIRSRLRAHDETMARLDDEMARLRDALVEVEKKLDRLEADHRAAEERVGTATQALDDLHHRADELSHTLTDRRARERSIREQIAQWEVERAQLAAQADHLQRMCRNELGHPLEDVIVLVDQGAFPVPTVMDADDVQAIDDRIQQLRRKLDGMGPINMVALDELEAQQERLSFLHKQREDVLASIASTEKALAEIKRRSRQRFVEAFQAINRYFMETFQELFGGGRGQMVLVDEANPLESGIEIIAQPPGKRLQNIMLLSGGEKSLTAIALLLAIFRYRPSPFCILDEVDSQLDDVNITRFSEKIKEMSQRTQFIIITHNKTTMQIADALHGVTMEEPGISKLVSVRLK